jgi:hypothetical protein
VDCHDSRFRSSRIVWMIIRMIKAHPTEIGAKPSNSCEGATGGEAVAEASGDAGMVQAPAERSGSP